jgi:two-component system sensor histidine kinase PfeS
VTLHADRAALGRVLENLLVNAGTHGGEGVAVHLRGRVEGANLHLEVVDDGPGMSAATLAALFEPFARGDEARAHPGTGLGLSIARTLVRVHGGDLTAESPAHAIAGPGAGPGTRFRIRLPVSTAPSANA